MTFGKHFINDVQDPVTPALRSLLTTDSSLRLIEDRKVLYREQPPNSRKVILLSGGGAGHEPAHAGYVGEGMLDVAVSGNIFASPSASQISAGLETLATESGVLFIVKNYTGDKLNFGLAAEKAKARGRKVRTVYVEDDVSIKANDLVGRRGLAGVVFVHKIAGAAAANGSSLEEVHRLAQKTADGLATAAVSLERCSVPSRQGQEGLGPDELEFGMGIHNEPGAQRAKLTSLNEIVERLIDVLLDNQAQSKSEVAVMVNNLGGLSVLELHAVADEILRVLSERIPGIVRVFIDTYITSLDGPGVSITLLNLDDELLPLLDAPTANKNWIKAATPYKKSSVAQQIVAYEKVIAQVVGTGTHIAALPRELVQDIIKNITKSVRRDEPQITRYDTLAGDGDCGTTLLNGVNAINQRLSSLELDPIDISFVFHEVALVVEEAMGGTSGAIYAIFFNAVSTAIRTMPSDDSTLKILQRSLEYGLKELCQYTTARIGDRTLMDALIPFVNVFARGNDFNTAVAAACEGAAKTKSMAAMLGRASYVSKEQYEAEGGIPDAGALGIVSILEGISQALSR